MKTAKDLMTAKPTMVQSGEELHGVVTRYIEKRFTTAPVITPLGEVLGVLTEVGLIRGYLKHYMEPATHEKVANHMDLLEAPVFVKEHDDLPTVIRALMKAPHHRVLVQDGNQRLLGIISPKDILVLLTGETRKSSDLREELARTKKRLSEMKKDLKEMANWIRVYEEAYHDAPVMAHSVDEKGRIIQANKKLHNVLKYDDGELVGRTMFDIYAPSVHHEATQGLQKIMEAGFHQSTYTTMITKTGEKIRVDIASAAVHDTHGKFVGTISISRVVDSETLLRALHGVLNSKDVDEKEISSLMGELKKAK